MDTWVLFGLGCALGTALADILTKYAAPQRALPEAILVRTLVPALLLAPLLLWLGWPRLAAGAAWWLALAWPLEVLALHLYIDSIRSGELARTLPWLALTPALSFAAAYALLGERLASGAAAGVLLVVAGCFLAHRGDAGAAGEALVDRRKRRRAMAQMAGVALIYAITPVLAKAAMGSADAFAFGIVYYTGVAALAATLIMYRQPATRRVMATLHPVDWAIALSIAAVVLLHYAALQLAAVPAFLALKRLSIVLGAVFGTIVLRERRTGLFWAPSTLVVAGVTLVVLR